VNTTSLPPTIALIGIAATFAVAAANLVYSILNNRKTAFVNTVTSSRLRWIESVRDKVSSFIAVTWSLANPHGFSSEHVNTLVRDRDTLLHQVVLHLNPGDAEDRAISHLLDEVASNTGVVPAAQVRLMLQKLRDATQVYLKKEWERVKAESKKGEQKKSEGPS
jgi:hypothetical protein